MKAFHQALVRASPARRERLVATMLKAIAGHRVGDRPGRVEPRANKRRPKKQRYLTEPRRAARKRLMANDVRKIRATFGSDQVSGAVGVIHPGGHTYEGDIAL